jgi:glutathione S-transferase
MLVLYHNDMSTCAQKVRFALAEKGVDWEGRHLDLRAGEQHEPEYLKLNPKGVVPTLVDDGPGGGTVVESNVIMEYVDDLAPENPLKPADPMQRARMRLWMKRLDDSIHAETGVISSAIAFRYQKLAEGREAAEKLVEGIPDEAKRARMRSIVFEGTASPLFAAGIDRFRKLIADMEDALSADDWLAGDAFTLADMAYAPYATRLEHLQLSGLWRPDSGFADWFARIKARPSYQTGLANWFNEKYLTLMAEKGAEVWPSVEKAAA